MFTKRPTHVPLPAAGWLIKQGGMDHSHCFALARKGVIPTAQIDGVKQVEIAWIEKFVRRSLRRSEIAAAINAANAERMERSAYARRRRWAATHPVCVSEPSVRIELDPA